MVSGSLGVTPGLKRQVSDEPSEEGALELSFEGQTEAIWALKREWSRLMKGLKAREFGDPLTCKVIFTLDSSVPWGPRPCLPSQGSVCLFQTTLLNIQCWFTNTELTANRVFPGGAGGKEPACQCRRPKRRRFDPWVGKILWGGCGNLLQYFYLESSMNRGAGRLQSIESQRVRHDWSDLACTHAQPTACN